jgi:CheY-like chemotaxis protein
MKIFLVENHIDTLTYLSSYLRACGHEVDTARDMASALEAVPDGDFDVLLCDIGLPDGDGWQLMRAVCERCDPPPFGVAMSGYGMKNDIEKSVAAGFRHHLVKPFLPADLDAVLREAAAPKPS